MIFKLQQVKTILGLVASPLCLEIVDPNRCFHQSLKTINFHTSLDYVNLCWLNVATGIPHVSTNFQLSPCPSACQGLSSVSLQQPGCYQVQWELGMPYQFTPKLYPVGWYFCQLLRFDMCHGQNMVHRLLSFIPKWKSLWWGIWILIIIEDHTLLWKICPSFNHGACDDTYRVSSKGKMRQAGKGHFQASSLWFYNYLSGTLKIHHNCGFLN